MTPNRMAIAWTITGFFIIAACLIACGKQPLNRVPPKTEVYYSGDRSDPCSKDEDDDIYNSLEPSAD